MFSGDCHKTADGVVLELPENVLTQLSFFGKNPVRLEVSAGKVTVRRHLRYTMQELLEPIPLA